MQARATAQRTPVCRRHSAAHDPVLTAPTWAPTCCEAGATRPLWCSLHSDSLSAAAMALLTCSPDVDAYLLHQYCEAAAALEAAGMRGPQRLRFLVEVSPRLLPG